MISKRINNVVRGTILTMILIAKAKIKFDSGPAKPTQIISLLGLRRERKFIGTGFAAPNIKRPWVAIKSTIGNNRVPMGSIWAKGLIVNLPAYLAVLSPSL